MVQLFFLKNLFVFSCMRTLLLLIITFFIATELVYSQDIPFSQSVYDARKQALFDSCLRNVTNNSSMIQSDRSGWFR